MEYAQLRQELDEKRHRMSFYPLAEFAKSPREFIKYRTKERTPPTDDMKIGIAFENLALRDDLGDLFIFDDTAMVEKLGGDYKNPRATKDYKEWKADQLAGKDLNKMITQQTYEVADAMRKRLWNHNYWKHYLADKVKETNVELLWEEQGIKFKGYVDATPPVMDLKKLQSAKYDKAKWVIRDRSYWMQVAMYADALGENTGYIVAADMSCEILILREQDLTPFKNRYKYYVEKFIECCERGAWSQGQEFWSENGYFDNDIY